ncbi:MAG TPA: AraC family transcriptional regulator [Chitinophagaceae bacterium]
MQPALNTSTFIFLITVILCFVAGLVLTVFSKNKMVNNRWLAGYYFVIGYGLLVAFVLYSKLIFEYPWYHTYRTGYVAAFLLMPLSFFYIRSLIQQKRFRPIDLVHFLPATIFLIDFIPFYFKPAVYKLEQLAIDSQGFNTIWNEFSQGWLDIGFIYVPLRIALTVVYWIWQVRIIIHSGKVKDGQNLLVENRNVMKWVKIFCASQVLFFVPYYINNFFGSQQHFTFVIHTLLAVGTSSTILVLILRPDILYGLKGIMIRDMNSVDDRSAELAGKKEILKDADILIAGKVDGRGHKTSNEIYLSRQKLGDLGKQVNDHVSSKNVFLKKGVTAAELAADMNIQPYLLSAIINQVYKTNFNDFLNGYRINHAKTLIQNGEARLLTLEALSEQCGFSNRNSFTMAFKKHAGRTPSDFIKQTGSSKN